MSAITTIIYNDLLFSNVEWCSAVDHPQTHPSESSPPHQSLDTSRLLVVPHVRSTYGSVRSRRVAVASQVISGQVISPDREQREEGPRVR